MEHLLTVVMFAFIICNVVNLYIKIEGYNGSGAASGDWF